MIEVMGLERTKDIKLLFRLPFFTYFLAWDRKVKLFVLAKKLWNGKEYFFKIV